MVKSRMKAGGRQERGDLSCENQEIESVEGGARKDQGDEKHGQKQILPCFLFNSFNG